MQGRRRLVGVGVDVVLRLDETELGLSRAVALARVLVGTGALVDDLRLAVRHDQRVLRLVIEWNDLSVERSALKSCECHGNLLWSMLSA